MAVPKRKHSSTRRDKRRASNIKMDSPALSTCTHCGELTAPHKACVVCGYYKGEHVVAR